MSQYLGISIYIYIYILVITLFTLYIKLGISVPTIYTGELLANMPPIGYLL